MRILFFGTPALGHLLPMLPLAAAARRAGHRTALVTHASMAGAVAPLAVLPAGADLADTLAEVTRRTGADAATDMTPRVPAEFFAGTRVDLGIDGALGAAGDFDPDLIIAEVGDYLGPLVAAALDLPWAAHGWGLPLDTALLEAFDSTVASRYTTRGLTPTSRAAYLDPWPGRLHRAGWIAPADRITVRPEPHSTDEIWTAPSFPGREHLPLVLVTLGTVVDDPTVLEAIVNSLGSADVNVIVATTAGTDHRALAADRAWVHPVGFIPMRQLLRGVDVVVSAAGAGTVSAAAATAVPMVLYPMGLDKPWIAERAEAAGNALVVRNPEEVGPAVRRVLATQAFKTAATALADDIARMNDPDTALRLLLDTQGWAP